MIKPFTDVVHIGIGGSDLGPRFVATALRAFWSERLRVHFVSNVDPDELTDTLHALNPATTLFISASKSFTTLETLTNTTAARRWLQAAAGAHSVDNHFIAITANPAKAQAFGIPASADIADVGLGRRALFAVVRHRAAHRHCHRLGQLSKRCCMAQQRWMRTTAARRSPPTCRPCSALLEWWYSTYWQAHSALVLPYSHRLRLFPAFLQQLSMESLGKSVDVDGLPHSGHSGLVVWGEPGTNSQHSFMQLLHQGTRLIPVDFIAIATTENDGDTRHTHLYANCLSQSRALMVGKSRAQAEQELAAAGMDREHIEALGAAQSAIWQSPEQHHSARCAHPRTLGSADRTVRTQGIHPERTLEHQCLRSVGRGTGQASCGNNFCSARWHWRGGLRPLHCKPDRSLQIRPAVIYGNIRPALLASIGRRNHNRLYGNTRFKEASAMQSIESSRIAVIGLGYVGLPLAVEFGKQLPTVGFDINTHRVGELRRGVDSTLETTATELAEAKQLTITDDHAALTACNVYIVTVPTPVDDNKQPDLTPLRKASETVGKVLKAGDVVIYESTVYPGATEEVCVPVMEKISGLKFNIDFFAGYSPERINPGDKQRRLTNILKITSGSTPAAADFVDALYRRIITAGTHKASTIRVAEAAKVIENTQRDVNIALVNELAQIFKRLGIDTEDVLKAAGTKWNFLPYRPGLVGGHCIGVDPYYLASKAQQHGYFPEIITASRRINDNMGVYVASEVMRLMTQKRIHIVDANILVMGLAFKENCPDLRNTRVVDIVAGADPVQCQCRCLRSVGRFGPR